MQITRERLEIQTCNKHRLSPFAESFLTSYCTLENSKWFLRSWGGASGAPPLGTNVTKNGWAVQG